MKIFLILLNFLNFIPASNSQSEENCKIFNDCLKDFVPTLSFKDPSYNSDALKFVSIPPETWNKICPKSYKIVKCLEKSNCHSNFYGVMDMIIYACHQNPAALTKFHKCPQKDKVTEMFSKCMISDMYNCTSVQEEYKCILNLGKKSDYCLTSEEFGEIYSAMFQPRNQVNLRDCKEVSEGCTSYIVSMCSFRLGSFISNFPSAMNDETDTSARYERHCKEINNGLDCFKKNKCFVKNALTSYNFKYKWDAVDFMCNKNPLEIKKVNKCYTTDDFFHLRLKECKKISNDATFCKNLLESKTCTLNVVKGTADCLDPNIYNGYYSILVDFQHKFFCTPKTENPVGEKSTGEKSTGEKSTGEKSTGEKSTGEKSIGEKTTGEKSTGEKSTGEKSTGEKSTGEKLIGEKSTDEKSAGENSPKTPKTVGENPIGESTTVKNSTGKLIGSSGLIMLLLMVHCYFLSEK